MQFLDKHTICGVVVRHNFWQHHFILAAIGWNTNCRTHYHRLVTVRVIPIYCLTARMHHGLQKCRPMMSDSVSRQGLPNTANSPIYSGSPMKSINNMCIQWQSTDRRAQSIINGANSFTCLCVFDLHSAPRSEVVHFCSHKNNKIMN
jgi:hypothetical protein